MKLAQILKDRSISDADMAQRLGCAHSTVFQWRVGAQLPRADYVKKICETLQCSADELLGIDVEKPTRLNRAQSVELLQAVTKSKRYDSQVIHQMATRVRQSKGDRITEFEKWLRGMAEALYKIEVALRPKPPLKSEGIQLSLF